MDEVKFIYGDMHLNEKAMFGRIYSETFETQEEYYETTIKNWNRIVQDNDVILVLGDLGRNKDFLRGFFSKLKGRKWLILGNHDSFPKNFYRELFEMVFVGPVAITKRIIASHEPIPVEPGIINLHGHTHYVTLKSDAHINMCPEWWKYTPVPINHFKSIIGHTPKPKRKFLHEWFKDIQLPTGGARKDLILKEDGTIDAEKSIEVISRMRQESNLDKNKNL